MNVPPFTRSPLLLLGVAAVASLGAVLANADPLEAAAAAGGTALLVVAVVTDLRERRVPNAWTYPSMVGALLLAAIAGLPVLLAALGGLAVAGGLLWAGALVSGGAIGMGDVKLAAAVGALLGPAGAAAFLLAGGIAGGVLGLGWLLAGHGRREGLPYAPALAVGAVITVLTHGLVVA